MRQRVSVVRLDRATYPETAPFHPSERYPEYPFGDALSALPNPVYSAVRALFHLLELDDGHRGTADWNPLGFIVEPGMTVVLKPNFVTSAHRDKKDLYSLVTHPAVIRAVMDYCWIALRGTGRLVIADAPQYDCNFEDLIAKTHLDQVLDFYNRKGAPGAELYDLRHYWSRWKHFPSLLEPLPGDPQGTFVVNLGKRSALYNKPHPDKLYGAVYHRHETIAHHHDETHEYQVSRTVMGADVVISLPKLKVHKKVGVTLNLKGLVGVATNKNYLVHYSLTPPREGGDQFPDGLLNPMEARLINTERWMYDHLLAPRQPLLEYLHRSIYRLHNSTTRRLGLKVDEHKRQLDAGNWYGNDSAWRMAVDLAALFHFADREGTLQDTRQRRMFSVIDGVVGGQNNGPLAPDPVRSGVLLAGQNYLAVDLVATRLMGFDPMKVKVLSTTLAHPDFDFGVRRLDEIEVLTNVPAWADCLGNPHDAFLNFAPHPGWAGHLEIQPGDDHFALDRPNRIAHHA